MGKGKGEDSKEEGKAAKTMDVRGAARRSVSGKNQTVIELIPAETLAFPHSALAVFNIRPNISSNTHNPPRAMREHLAFAPSSTRSLLTQSCYCIMIPVQTRVSVEGNLSSPQVEVCPWNCLGTRLEMHNCTPLLCHSHRPAALTRSWWTCQASVASEPWISPIHASKRLSIDQSLRLDVKPSQPGHIYLMPCTRHNHRKGRCTEQPASPKP